MANSDAKTVDARTVETLVREVLARMTASSGAPNGQPTASSVSGANPVATAATISVGELVIRQTVVSTGVLADRLSGVSKLVVMPRAVITPAAKDLLKQHRIAISRTAGVSQGSKPSLVVGVADTAFDPAALVRMVAPLAGGIERLAKTGVATVVAEVAEAVTKEGRLGLVLSGKPHVAACLANRQRGVRAAVARDREEVAEALGSLGLNLLVVDPARRTLFQLGQMVRQFLEAGPMGCPADLKEQLG